jgi:hypothetical protein
MAKINGPLLSLGGAGQIGKTVVFSSWKGIKYARQYVVPANPQTTAQQANRTRFAFLREMFKLAPTEVRDPFAAFVQGRPLTPDNKFVGENNRLLVGETDLAAMNMSPGAKGGLPLASFTAAQGSATGEIDCTIVGPSQLPVGWTIVEAAAAAVLDQDPVGIFNGPFVADVDATDPYEITLTGMGAAEDCMAFGWMVYEKPDGQLAYSVSLSDAVTSGA